MTKVAVFGLGNPGKNYAFTRHNAGFLFLDFLKEKFNTDFLKLKKATCEYLKVVFDKKTLFLVKPLTFMNLSGNAVFDFCQYFNIDKEKIIIVHDDLDIPLGKFRFDFARGPKSHKGLISVEDRLKTKNFWRIRIGIDNRAEAFKIKGEEYVLQKFLPSEMERIKEVFQKIYDRLPEILGKVDST